MKYVIAIVVTMFCSSAFAGSPGSKFMNSTLWVAWENEGDKWLMTYISYDKATKKTTEASFVFQDYQGKVYIIRAVIDGNDIQRGFLINVLAPIIQQAGRKK